MAKNEYLAGIGGWLGFLIVGLMILGPLVGLGRLFGEFSDAERQFPQLVVNTRWSNYKQASWLILAVSVAISFSAGYRLWKIHFSESVRFAIVALWLSGPFGNLLYLTTTVVVFGSQTMSSALPEMLGGIIGSCIAAGIWTAYLVRSVRVQNTYKSSLSAEAAK